ncbi:hypothetical protein L9F63_003025 [Diploptera punctata]|uniref:Reverse transcriptase zinc-binding domain-containing protein n=1 Tax=Diploptera punctata TaxID=6984 RepID=A0AAD7ZQT8_DIPPU|nr:hypothetical protein L9F63_003025 [Diploptera punctata]
MRYIHTRQETVLNPTFVLTQFLTNHGKFQQYLHRIGKAASPKCPCSEDDQTAMHLLLHCKLQEKNRPAHIKDPNIVLRKVIKMPQTIKYINEIFQTLK